MAKRGPTIALLVCLTGLALSGCVPKPAELGTTAASAELDETHPGWKRWSPNAERLYYQCVAPSCGPGSMVSVAFLPSRMPDLTAQLSEQTADFAKLGITVVSVTPFLRRRVSGSDVAEWDMVLDHSGAIDTTAARFWRRGMIDRSGPAIEFLISVASSADDPNLARRNYDQIAGAWLKASSCSVFSRRKA